MTSDLPLLPSPSTLVLDSGATGHFSKPSDITTNVQPATPGVRVKMPNATIIRSTHTGTLPLTALQQLPTTASTTHIIPNLHQSLISLGTLCDHGCTAELTATDATIKYNNKPILKGSRQKHGFWTILPDFKKQHKINSVISHDTITNIASKTTYDSFTPHASVQLLQLGPRLSKTIIL